MYFGNQLSNKTSITLHVILQSRIYEIVYLSMSIRTLHLYLNPLFTKYKSTTIHISL